MTAPVLLILARGLMPTVAGVDAENVALRVRVYADGLVDDDARRRALPIATGLLSTAGITVFWRVCDAAASCPPQDGPTPEVVLIFSSRPGADARGRCAMAALGAVPSTGTVRVAIPCVGRVADRLRQRLDTRAHPLLAIPEYGDLVGLAVAHEIGHVLGLPHAQTGVMRARLGPEDILALRQERLAFSARESGTMRLCLVRARALDQARAARPGARETRPKAAADSSDTGH